MKIEQPGRRKRVRIPLEAGKEAQIRDRVIEVIASYGGIFQRGHSLVSVLPESDDSPAVIIREIPQAALRGKLSEMCEFTTKRKIHGLLVEVACDVPKPLVEIVHSLGHWSGVPYLDRVIDAPSIRKDGSILQAPGYDAATRCLYVPSADFLPIPENPSQEEAGLALTRLTAVFSDFPLVDLHARSVVIAAILTLIGRTAIDGSVPLFCFDANTRGSGKTLLADLVSTICNGRPVAKLTFGLKEEELEKQLSSFALLGASYICFDNVDCELGGGPLDKCLTSNGPIAFRLLGKSEIRQMLWFATIVATGNNLRFRGDTTRRLLLARLESQDERPEERTGFQIQNVRQWTAEHRSRLVSDALTILRAWFVAGRPTGDCKVWGSFEAWSEIIPPAIVFAGGANPMAHRGELEAATHDSEREAALIVLAYLPKFGSTGITVQDLIRALYPNGAAPKSDVPPDGYNDLRDALEMLGRSVGSRPPSSNELGFAFKKLRDRWFADRRLVSRKGRSNRSLWFIEAREGRGESGEAQSALPSEEI